MLRRLGRILSSSPPSRSDRKVWLSGLCLRQALWRRRSRIFRPLRSPLTLPPRTRVSSTPAPVDASPPTAMPKPEVSPLCDIWQLVGYKPLTGSSRPVGKESRVVWAKATRSTDRDLRGVLLLLAAFRHHQHSEATPEEGIVPPKPASSLHTGVSRPAPCCFAHSHSQDGR